MLLSELGRERGTPTVLRSSGRKQRDADAGRNGLWPSGETRLTPAPAHCRLAHGVGGSGWRGGAHWAGGWGRRGEEGRARSKVDTSVLEIVGRAKACLSHKRDFVNHFLGRVLPPLGMSFLGGTPAECSPTKMPEPAGQEETWGWARLHRGRLWVLSKPLPPGLGALTRDAGAHAVCTCPGSHREALGTRGWGGKPLAGPHPPPGWNPGQAVSGPAVG